MSNRHLGILVPLILLPSSAFAQEEKQCSCTPYPFNPDPPCLSICASDFVRGYSAEQIFAVLDVAPRTELGIRSFQDFPGQANTLYDILRTEEVNDLRRAFEDADQEQLNNMLLELFVE